MSKTIEITVNNDESVNFLNNILCCKFNTNQADIKSDDLKKGRRFPAYLKN